MLAETEQSPVDLHPVEPLFTGCAPPSPQQVPVLDATVRNHVLAVADEPGGQDYKRIVTGDPGVPPWSPM